MDKVELFKKELNKLKNPVQATLLQSFFKTGPGEYGAGDIFWGIKVPLQRRVIKNYLDLNFEEIKILLASKIHEHRFCALLILMAQFKKGDSKQKKKVFDMYLSNTAHINNWDLVDVTCPRIVGEYLLDKDRKILYKLAISRSLWERRISIIATAMFIQQDDYLDTLKIAEILLNDKHDLIHKAVGWMLREVGKRDRQVLEMFLNKYYKVMPRTMLRYAIEKLPEEVRRSYLKKSPHPNPLPPGRGDKFLSL